MSSIVNQKIIDKSKRTTAKAAIRQTQNWNLLFSRCIMYQLKVKSVLTKNPNYLPLRVRIEWYCWTHLRRAGSITQKQSTPYILLPLNTLDSWYWNPHDLPKYNSTVIAISLVIYTSYIIHFLSQLVYAFISVNWIIPTKISIFLQTPKYLSYHFLKLHFSPINVIFTHSLTFRFCFLHI